MIISNRQLAAALLMLCLCSSCAPQAIIQARPTQVLGAAFEPSTTPVLVTPNITTAQETPTIVPTAMENGWIPQVEKLLAETVQTSPLSGAVVGIRIGNQPMVIRGYGAAEVVHGSPINAETPFSIASITKQFTAAAILQLAEAGKLSLDDPVARFFPDLPADAQQVKIRHMLTHTSGLPDVVGQRIHSYELAETPQAADSQIDLGGVFAEPVSEAGAAYAYNNTGFWILGRIIEKVSGENYADYLAQHLFQPLGLQHTTFCADAPAGMAQGYTWDANSQTFHPLKNDLRLLFSAGGLCSTARDLLTWQQALANGKVISAEDYREMTTPVRLNDSKTVAYGFGLALDSNKGEAMVSHGGALPGVRTLLANYPARDITIVVLINSENGQPMRLVESILPLLGK